MPLLVIYPKMAEKYIFMVNMVANKQIDVRFIHLFSLPFVQLGAAGMLEPILSVIYYRANR